MPPPVACSAAPRPARAPTSPKSVLARYAGCARTEGGASDLRSSDLGIGPTRERSGKMRRGALLGLAVGISGTWLLTSKPWAIHCRFDRETERAARTLHGAAVDWLARNPRQGCPSAKDLYASGSLDPAAEAVDEWGRPMQVLCEGPDPSVRSAGTDSVMGTRDDVVIPKSTHQ